LNFYKRHLGDYAKDAGHLTMLEHGAYTLLLDRYYTTEKPIPSSAEAYRVCRARSSVEKAAVDAVLAEFFITDGVSFLNRRADEEIAKASHQRSVNQELGKRGGRPKKTDSVSEDKTDSVANSNPSQTPDSRLQKYKDPPPSGAPAAGAAETARGLRLPDGWEPGADGMAFAEQQGLRNGRAQAELAKFRDYWAAQPGAKGRKADWQATWRNWARKAAESAPPKHGPAAVTDLTDLFRRGQG